MKIVYSILIALTPAFLCLRAGEPPKEILVNRHPITWTTLSPTSLDPEVFGKSPDYILNDERQIKNLLRFLFNTPSSQNLDSRFVRFIFRYLDKVVYVDASGFVLAGNRNFKVDPIALTELLNSWGHPERDPSVPIPLDWSKESNQ